MDAGSGAEHDAPVVPGPEMDGAAQDQAQPQVVEQILAVDGRSRIAARVVEDDAVVAGAAQDLRLEGEARARQRLEVEPRIERAPIVETLARRRALGADAE